MMAEPRVTRLELGPEEAFPLGAIEPGRSDPVHTVAELLPDGYARYLRVFHPFLPADPGDRDKVLPGPPRTWRSLADEAGAVFHPELMSWSLIDALGWENEHHRFLLSEGRLDEPARSALFGILAASDAGDAFYLYFLNAIVRARDHAPLLYRAPLVDLDEVHAAASELLGDPPDKAPGPEFVWPLDRSWMVTTDYDLESTYVACDDRIAEQILSAADIEALPLTRWTRVDNEIDQINRAGTSGDSSAAPGDVDEH